MRRIACLGCLFLVLATSILLGLVVSGLLELDWFSASPRHNTRAIVGDAAPLRLQVNLATRPAAEVFSSALPMLPESAVAPFVPYEAAVSVTPDFSAGVNSVVYAVSLRRLGDVLALLARDPARWSLPAMEAQAAQEEAPGLWVVRGTAPLPPTLGQREGLDTTPPESGGGHDFELVLDNRDGRGYLAVAGFLPLYTPAELVPLFEPARLPAWFARLAWGRLVADFENGDTLRVLLDAQAVDAASVGALRLGIAAWRDALLRQALDAGIQGELSLSVVETRVRGEGQLLGVHAPLAQWLSGGLR